MRVVYLMIFSFIVTFARGQVQEEVTPTEKRYQSIVTEPLTLYKGFSRGTVSASFVILDKTFNDSGQRRLVDENGNGRMWQIAASAQYGITDRLQVSVRIPYVHNTITLSNEVGVVSWDSSFSLKRFEETRGVSDVSTSVTFQILHGSYTRPFLGVTLTSTFPTGEKNPTEVNPENNNDYKRPPGRGVFDIQVSVTYRHIRFPYSWDVGIGYTNIFPGRKKFRPADNAEVSFKPGNIVVGTASFNIHLNNWIILKTAVTGGYSGEGHIDNVKGTGSYIVNGAPALVFQLKGFRLTSGISFSIAGKNITANPNFSSGISYTF